MKKITVSFEVGNNGSVKHFRDNIKSHMLLTRGGQEVFSLSISIVVLLFFFLMTISHPWNVSIGEYFNGIYHNAQCIGSINFGKCYILKEIYIQDMKYKDDLCLWYVANAKKNCPNGNLLCALESDHISDACFELLILRMFRILLNMRISYDPFMGFGIFCSRFGAFLYG